MLTGVRAGLAAGFLGVALIGATVPAGAGAAAAGVATKEMTDCAALGPKHPGSAADVAQGNRIIDRFKAAGLQTSAEAFRMPVWEEGRVTVRGVGPGAPAPPAESFAYGGTGDVTAEVIDLGNAAAGDF